MPNFSAVSFFNEHENPQAGALLLTVPPGGLLFRTFTSWKKVHRPQPGLNPRTLDTEVGTLPRYHPHDLLHYINLVIESMRTSSHELSTSLQTRVFITQAMWSRGLTLQLLQRKSFMIQLLQWTCCLWSHGLRQKRLYASVAVSPAPVRVPSERSFGPSVASVTSVG